MYIWLIDTIIEIEDHIDNLVFKEAEKNYIWIYFSNIEGKIYTNRVTLFYINFHVDQESKWIIREQKKHPDDYSIKKCCGIAFYCKFLCVLTNWVLFIASQMAHSESNSSLKPTKSARVCAYFPSWVICVWYVGRAVLHW